MKKCVPVSFFVFLFTISNSHGISDSLASKAISICPEQIAWTESKPPLPAGAKVAILEGDPKKEGLFVMRIKFPAHCILPSHIHFKDERVLILSGSMYVGIGDRPDKKNAKQYNAGCFYVNPAGIHHYVYTEEEGAVVQLTGFGPWGLQFIEVKN